MTLILIATLISAINMLMNEPYPHKDVMPSLLIKNYPDVTVNHSYDGKLPIMAVKVKKSNGGGTVGSWNSSMSNSSAPNRSNVSGK